MSNTIDRQTEMAEQHAGRKLSVPVRSWVQKMIGTRVAFGILALDRTALEDLQRKGRQLDTTVVGLAQVLPDVTPELARDIIRHLRVVGTLQISEPLREGMGDRLAYILAISPSDSQG